MKSGNLNFLEPSGPLQACNGTDLPLPTRWSRRKEEKKNNNRYQATPSLLPHLFNPLNAELNPICHLLALLGARHIFHVSGLRVNSRQLQLPKLNGLRPTLQEMFIKTIPYYRPSLSHVLARTSVSQKLSPNLAWATFTTTSLCLFTGGQTGN